MTRSVDALDLKIAEAEAKVVTEIRRLIVQECLGRCRVSHSGCPYLESVKICRNINRLMKEEVPLVLLEMSEKN